LKPIVNQRKKYASLTIPVVKEYNPLGFKKESKPKKIDHTLLRRCNTWQKYNPYSKSVLNRVVALPTYRQLLDKPEKEFKKNERAVFNYHPVTQNRLGNTKNRTYTKKSTHKGVYHQKWIITIRFKVKYWYKSLFQYLVKMLWKK